MSLPASSYPDMYADLGIDTGELGCIMVDTDIIRISDVISESDYYYSEEKEFVKGNVSEDVPHVTLLYGLLSSGPAMQKHVTTVLNGWAMDMVEIEKVSFFYGEDSEFVTIIAMVTVTDILKDAHSRLSLLPHIDTFDEYRPHITLAYVRSDSPWQTYIDKLNTMYAGSVVTVKGINLGD